MVSANPIIFSCIALMFSDFGRSLVEISDRNNNILTTERIHNTINNLFKTLKINEVSEKPSLKEYITVHKYFTALTSESHQNVNEIARFTKINTNKKASLVDTINDVLEEDDFETAKIAHKDDNDVTHFMQKYLNNLQVLKQEFNVDKVHANVNTDVLRLLDNSKEKQVNNVSNAEISLDKSEEDYINTNDTDLWEPSGRRIFKGERTKIKRFPFMAVIQIFNSFHCAGSIIKSDLIITASSCLQLAWNNRFFRENPAFLSVRVGSSFYNGGGEVISVLEVYFHPSYNPKTLRNNICLLRLSRQIKFKRRERKVKKIDFDRHDSNLPYNTYGVTVVGWGAKEHSPIIGNAWKNIISYAVLDVYPLEDCQDIYSREYVTKKNFCAGFLSKGGGACNRDVGGPGIVNGKLMGVISFGSPVCGMPDAPTVFTKLGYYTDWIEEIMEQKVPVSKKRTTLKPVIDLETFTYKPSKPTTFKIPPITGKTMTPIPISHIDSQLRIMDEKVFKDFLVTMFNSKEIQEYKDILQGSDETIVDLRDNKKDLNKLVLDETISVTEHQKMEEPYTNILDASADDESGKTHFDTAYTVIDEENNHNTQDFDKEMSKIMDTVDLERIVKEEVLASPNNVSMSSLSEDNIQDEVGDLNLSEDENNVEMVEDKINNKDDEGMSIPVNIFEDMTRAKDNADGVLPESVVYELLSEVIKDEVQNINVNSYGYFIFENHFAHFILYNTDQSVCVLSCLNALNLRI